MTFRVRHPSLTAEQISLRLGMQPDHSLTVGQPRATPKGAKLEGANRDTHWSCVLNADGARDSAVRFESFLAKTFEMLKKHQAFLGEVSRTGGRASLFIGLFLDANSGFSLEPTLSRHAAELPIALDFDVYPPDVAV